MTRTKKAFIVALSVIFVLCIGVSCLAACSNKVLDSITVDSSKAKTKYVSGEQLNTDGLVVTATFTTGNGKTKEQVLKADEYTVGNVSLTLAGGQFQTVKKVNVSYTHGEATKTAYYNVTVTKKVTSVVVDSKPNKTEYRVGEKFDPTGLKITATYEDNTSNKVDITAENATWNPSAEIPKGTTKVTVTYGGYSFNVDITMVNAVYIEAEQGLYNGRPVPEVNAELNDQGKKIRTDATLSNAQEGAEKMYRAHLNAIHAEDVEAKVVAYKAGTNDDIEEWNYQELVERFHASDDLYLGNIGVGDTVSFVFSSSEATTGDIAFRLASGYLKRDDNWAPIEMGDIDFSKLCDLYVNGVKKVIKEGNVILEGGATEDGSACQQLWVLWSLVTFDDIDFVEGRNVIELKFKDCGLRNSHNNSFTCNVDSLIISPASDSTADIDLYDNTKAGEDLLAHLTVVSIAFIGKKLTIGGNVTDGYYADIFSVNVGKTLAKVTLEAGNFTAVIDLDDVAYGESAVQVNGVTIEKGKLTLPDKVSLEDAIQTTYELIEKNGAIYLVKDASQYFIFDKHSLTKGNSISLQVERGRVYYVIEGNTFDCTYVGYEGEELERLTELIADYINAPIYFQIQNYPPAVSGNDDNWEGDWTEYGTWATERQVIVDLEKGTYTLKIDITDIASGSKCINKYDFNHNSTGKEDGWNDYKPTGVEVGANNIVTEVTHNGKTYQIVYYQGSGRASEFWGCIGIVVNNA